MCLTGCQLGQELSERNQGSYIHRCRCPVQNMEFCLIKGCFNIIIFIFIIWLHHLLHLDAQFSFIYVELRPHAPVGPPQITTVGDALQIDISGSQPSGEPPNYTNASVQGYLNGFLIRVEAEDSGYIYHFMVGFCHLSLCIISLIFDSLFQYSACLLYTSDAADE